MQQKEFERNNQYYSFYLSNITHFLEDRDREQGTGYRAMALS
jgi:hypothetical protein